MIRRERVQIIKNMGKPEWAVIPYKDYLRLAEFDKMSDQIHSFKKDLASGKEELISNEFAVRLIKGENPIRVWREYRSFNQAELAKSVGISPPYLSQLERSNRHASTKTLTKLANKLKVSIDDLI